MTEERNYKKTLEKLLDLLIKGYFYEKTHKRILIKPFSVNESSRYILGYNKGIIDVLNEIESFIEGDLNL